MSRILHPPVDMGNVLQSRMNARGGSRAPLHRYLRICMCSGDLNFNGSRVEMVEGIRLENEWTSKNVKVLVVPTMMMVS